MEEPSTHGVSNNGETGHATRPSSLSIPENGGSDDPPPIPNASSSSYLTEKSVGESRLKEYHSSDQNDPTTISDRAHTLKPNQVAYQLSTNIQCVNSAILENARLIR